MCMSSAVTWEVRLPEVVSHLRLDNNETDDESLNNQGSISNRAIRY
ncbi:MAG: hypothetical protein IPG44_11705 [Anaerolineales bacterium]|nr:hypothetical protein [Anaerolineales bacterium]